MSDFIRMLGLKMSRKGTCNKCGQPRDKGSHAKCDRWPAHHGCGKGFRYVSNAKESTLEDLKDIVRVICSGEHPQTPVRFEIRIMQTANVPEGADTETEKPAQSLYGAPGGSEGG